MVNMAYCRFENTVDDMRDCIDALCNAGWDLQEMMDNASSEHEARYMKVFVNLCQEVAEKFEGVDT